MKLSFFALRNILNAALTTAVLMRTVAVASVIPEDNDSNAVDKDTPTFIMSQEEMMHWIANTDAELTFVGDPVNSLSSHSAQVTTVTYCTTRRGSVCGGSCVVHTSSASCINTPGTNCLAATNNVAFCTRAECDGDCHELNDCATPLADGYCFTPGTNSILISHL